MPVPALNRHILSLSFFYHSYPRCCNICRYITDSKFVMCLCINVGSNHVNST
jgi:hypothetical protein